MRLGGAWEKWRADRSNAAFLKAAVDFCLPSAAAKRRSRFFEGYHALRFQVIDHAGAEIFRKEFSLKGETLLGLLGLFVDTSQNEIIDGTPCKPKRRAHETSVIAFYLPQFYPFSENDLWWGEGFTEWSNVVDAEPQLENHNMPLWPADLGFYDLRVEDTRRRQAQLAAQYGIDGFCYYFYWFSGKRLMRDVLDRILSSGEPSTDFCLCWANESWSRRWDGTEGQADLLISQKHDPEIDKILINDLLPYFYDERYIKIDGSPMLLIYRLDIMNNPEEVIKAWTAAAHQAGFPGIYTVAVRSFGLTDQAASAVDAIVDFPPHSAVSSEIQNSLKKNRTFEGKVFDYRQVVIEATTRTPGDKLTFPGIMPRWDNTARKGDKAHIFWNSTPSAFKLWMTFVLHQSQQLPLGRRFLFINSWNEWGEGAMLEPDRHHGRAYLEALRSARGGYVLGPSDVAQFALVSNLPESGAEEMLRNFSAEVQMVSQIMSWQRAKATDSFRSGEPEIVTLSEKTPAERDGRMIFDYSSPKKEDGVIKFRYGQTISLIGWAMMNKESPHVWGRVAYIVFASVKDSAIAFHVPVSSWNRRDDVNEYFELGFDKSGCFFGFDICVSTDVIIPGTYQVSMVQAVDGDLLVARCFTPLEKLAA